MGNNLLKNARQKCIWKNNIDKQSRKKSKISDMSAVRRHRHYQNSSWSSTQQKNALSKTIFRKNCFQQNKKWHKKCYLHYPLQNFKSWKEKAENDLSMRHILTLVCLLYCLSIMLRKLNILNVSMIAIFFNRESLKLDINFVLKSEFWLLFQFVNSNKMKKQDT